MLSFTSKPLALYLFLLLILLRPVIDIFWWVKDTSIFLSPANWVGVVSVTLILWYFLKIKDKRQKVKGIWIFIAFSALVFVNAIGLIFPFIHSSNLSGVALARPDHSIIQTIGLSVKLVSFPLFFLFLYCIINKDNFDLILKVFLLSSLFPFLMIIYELLVGPINAYTPGGREFERYRGLYPDGINYTIYWLIGLTTSAYFYIKHPSKLNFAILTFVFCLIALSLFYLNQAIAYFVFSFLLIVVLVFVFRQNKIHFLTLTLPLTLIIILLYIPGLSKLSSLFQVDAEIIQGNLEIVHGANGRVWIWLEGLKQLKELPVLSWIFGAGLAGTDYLKYFTAGAHNDYLRILYSAGIIGLICYLLFISRLFIGFSLLEKHNKFLLVATIGSLLLFSVTHTPTFYLPFVYFLAAVSANFLRAKTQRTESN